jgi:hypothetical protein
LALPGVFRQWFYEGYGGCSSSYDGLPEDKEIIAQISAIEQRSLKTGDLVLREDQKFQYKAACGILAAF